MKTEQKNTQKTTAGDQVKRYLLFKALATKSVDKLRELPLQEFDLNITENFEDLQEIDSAVTPLIFIAFYGSKDMMRLLLASNHVDIDLQTENNRQTPLITACLCGNYQIVRMLLLAGAQPNKPNLLNQSPLAVALFRLVEEPSSFENRKICLMIADLLIKHGADPNWIIDKKRGWSLLHYFCGLKLRMNKQQCKLNKDIIKFLLDHGADPRQTTLDDKTCLELVAQHCNKEEITVLLAQNLAKPVKKEEGKRQFTPVGADYFKIDSKPAND